MVLTLCLQQLLLQAAVKVVCKELLAAVGGLVVVVAKITLRLVPELLGKGIVVAQAKMAALVVVARELLVKMEHLQQLAKVEVEFSHQLMALQLSVLVVAVELMTRLRLLVVQGVVALVLIILQVPEVKVAQLILAAAVVEVSLAQHQEQVLAVLVL